MSSFEKINQLSGGMKTIIVISGRGFVGCCPFHSDKGSDRKAFTVNPDNGLWRCFSCGAKGNAITFCQKKGIDVTKAPGPEPNCRWHSYGDGMSKKDAWQKAN